MGHQCKRSCLLYCSESFQSHASNIESARGPDAQALHETLTAFANWKQKKDSCKCKSGANHPKYVCETTRQTY